MNNSRASLMAGAGFGALSWFFDNAIVGLVFALAGAACWSVCVVAMDLMKEEA